MIRNKLFRFLNISCFYYLSGAWLWDLLRMHFWNFIMSSMHIDYMFVCKIVVSYVYRIIFLQMNYMWLHTNLIVLRCLGCASKERREGEIRFDWTPFICSKTLKFKGGRRKGEGEGRRGELYIQTVQIL